MGTGVMVVTGGYLLGSILPAVWFVRCRTGKMPWEMGDNPGTAGVWRLAGPGYAIFTGVFDIAKGIVPLAIARGLGLEGLWLTASACAPVIGHNWPVFHRFRGGRGLATASGALLYIAWNEMLPAYLFGILAAYRKKWAPMAGVVAFPVGMALMFIRSVDRQRILTALCVMLVVLLRQVPWLVEKIGER